MQYKRSLIHLIVASSISEKLFIAELNFKSSVPYAIRYHDDMQSTHI